MRRAIKQSVPVLESVIRSVACCHDIDHSYNEAKWGFVPRPTECPLARVVRAVGDFYKVVGEKVLKPFRRPSIPPRIPSIRSCGPEWARLNLRLPTRHPPLRGCCDRAGLRDIRPVWLPEHEGLAQIVPRVPKSIRSRTLSSQ